MKKVIVTEKGASLKTNNWIEGQEIECSESLANHFIERGIAIDPEKGVKPKEVKPKK